MEITGELVLGRGAILQLELERAADGSLAWDTVTAAAMTFEAGSLVRLLISDFAGGSLLALPQIPFLTCTSPGQCQLGAAHHRLFQLAGHRRRAGQGADGKHPRAHAHPQPVQPRHVHDQRSGLQRGVPV